MAVLQPIILTGNYLGPYARQQQAFNQQCLCVIEFHFDAAGNAAASGGEVVYQALNDVSKKFAEAMWQKLESIGLPPHGSKPVKSSSEVPRSRWIDNYFMPTILLEPLFISNTAQAKWLHKKAEILADAVVAGIQGSFPGGGRIGLSAGHAGKSHPDPGSPCVQGDEEVDHTLEMVNLVAQRLLGNALPACMLPSR